MTQYAESANQAINFMMADAPLVLQALKIVIFAITRMKLCAMCAKLGFIKKTMSVFNR